MKDVKIFFAKMLRGKLIIIKFFISLQNALRKFLKLERTIFLEG